MALFRCELSKIYKNRTLLIAFFVGIIICLFVGVLTPCDIDDDYRDNYKNNVEDIIYNARISYHTIDSKSNEIALYQLNVIEYYSKVVNVELNSNVKSCCSVLSSPIPYVLALSFGILVAFLLAYTEVKNNFILFAGYKSRIRVCVKKIFVLVCVVFTVLVSFVLSTLVGSSIIFSTGNLSSVIQSLQCYNLCPFYITIFEALFLRVLLSFATIIWVSLLVFVITILTRKPYIVCLCAAILIGTDLVRKISFHNPLSFGYNYGIINSLSDSWLQKYHGVKIFDSMISQPILIFIVSLLLSIIMVCITILVYKKQILIKSSINKHEVKSLSHNNIWYYEIKKCLSCGPIAIVLVTLLIHIIMLDVTYKNESDDFEKIYRYYITEMSDLSFEDQKKFVIELRIESNEIITNALAKKSQFRDGNVSYEEYSSAQQKAGAADLTLEVLSVVDQQLNAIENLKNNGIETKLVYSVGWKKYVDSGADYWLLVSLLIFTFFYSFVERRNRFSNIINPLYCGNRKEQKPIWVKRAIILASVSNIFILLFNFVDLAFFSLKFGLPNPESFTAGAGVLFTNKFLKLWEIVLLKYIGCVIGAIFIISMVITLSRVYELVNYRCHYLLSIFIALLSISTVIYAMFGLNLISFFGFSWLYNSWLTNLIASFAILVSILLSFVSYKINQYKHIIVQ